MSNSSPPLHLVVYDLGRPWKRGYEIALDYLRVFRRCPHWALMEVDLERISALNGDSYDFVVCTWDGFGPTPLWLWRDFHAVSVHYVSTAVIIQQ